MVDKHTIKYQLEDIEQARHAIDEAVTVWLRLHGFSEDAIGNMDYSFIDNELSDLLEYGVV